MANPIDQVRALTFDASDDELLNAFNSIGELPTTGEKFNAAQEKIRFILDVRKSREEIKLTKRLVTANWVLAVFTVILALATIALVIVTIKLPMIGA